MRPLPLAVSLTLVSLSSLACVRDANTPGNSYDSKPQGDESAHQSERADENKAVNEAAHTSP